MAETGCMERLAPEVRAFLKEMERLKLPPLSRDIYLTRRKVTEAMALKAPRAAHTLRKIKDRTVPGSEGEIPVRIYTPEGAGPFPILLFCHGGGWVVGSLAMEDHVCVSLAEKTPCLVISVDYRLAPEHPFPAALNDCYDVLCWAASQAHTFGGDPGRIAVSGESAGANLMIASTLMAKERGGPAAMFQLLFNPATNLADFASESHKEFAEGFIISRADMEATRDLYLAPGSDPANPYVSPLLAPDLKGLPPAFIITSGCDPLRDDGEAYAGRLEEAGVPVKLTRYEDMVHAFLCFFRSSDAAKRALTEASDALREAFNA